MLQKYSEGESIRDHVGFRYGGHASSGINFVQLSFDDSNVIASTDEGTNLLQLWEPSDGLFN